MEWFECTLITEITVENNRHQRVLFIIARAGIMMIEWEYQFRPGVQKHKATVKHHGYIRIRDAVNANRSEFASPFVSRGNETVDLVDIAGACTVYVNERRTLPCHAGIVRHFTHHLHGGRVESKGQCHAE